MQKLEKMYSGKAKNVYATDDPALVVVEYRDDATALNGKKKGSFEGKGVLNNRISNHIFKQIAAAGVKTHLVEELSDRETLCRRVTIVPLEVIIRNVAAGSFSRNYGVPEGTALKCTVLEFSLKNDELNDPLINDYQAIAIGAATREDIEKISAMAFRINEVMKDFFAKLSLKLVDFKLEFGVDADGEIILADEISPDTCRLWDMETNEKLDKDRFRRDLGGFEEAYVEVWRRIQAQAK